MKKAKSLRGMLIPAIFFSSVFTIGLFALISQYRLWSSIKGSMEREVQNSMEKSDQCLDLVLDKYETLLYELCTDDQIIEIVENININEDDLDVNGSMLRRRLSHICNSNVSVEGIVVDTINQKRFFYDSLSSSSSKSSWTTQIPVPIVEKGVAYRWKREPVLLGDEEIYMFQIARRLVDYRDIHKPIGTVVISINENELRDAVDFGGKNQVFLLDGDSIVSAPEKILIGEEKELVFQPGMQMVSKMNERSGWEIVSLYELSEYRKAIWGQAGYYLLIAVGIIGIMVILVDYITRPILKSVDTVVEAMNTAESGDFSVRIPIQETMSIEVQRIASRFNEMVGQLDELLKQIKQAVLEQKNAELSALEAQIDPHFLYNTLDTINWKAIENEQYEISEMVGALADILRYAVRNAGARTTIRQEISWLEQYILLQSARLGRELDLQIDITDEAWNCRIHKLLMQPFVENAIKHGLYKKEGDCVLKISMSVEDHQLHIIIEDNGKGISEGLLGQLNDKNAVMGEHLGIVNVRRRLRLYYSGKASLHFESCQGSYTRVHLFIPAEEV
ncbi:sensor histidine kinase [Clostridium sp. chh4-2]|uniref:sensor histidine kinase n=1 Tax=Clostridium sp. chh4-2 TaxID=2067550 RepID=UPI000CCF6AA4|nr:sensor histidine kinase [Clostridium sp. chh4-2]PNV59395.1 sensor histidine kinase [Clostridium sp. chh4-2]